MALRIRHPFTSAFASIADATKLRPLNWNADHVIEMMTGNVVGRTSGGTGSAEELPTTGTGAVVLQSAMTAAIAAAVPDGIFKTLKDFGATGGGVVDDTVAVQAAMDSGEPYLYVPDGIFNITPISVPATVKGIFGPGTLKAAGAISDWDKLLQFGAAVTGCIISGITIDVSPITYPTISCVIAYGGASGVKLRNVKFVNGGRLAFHGDGAPNCEISDCFIQNCYQSPVFANDCDNIMVLDNEILRGNEATMGMGVSIIGGSNARIERNYVSGGQVGATNWSIGLSDTTRGIIADNVVIDAVYESLGVDAGGAGGADAVENVVRNNLIIYTNGNGVDYGMHVDSTPPYKCLRTTVMGNTIIRSGNSAIGVDRESEDTMVIGNVIIDPNNEGTDLYGSYFGIDIYNGALNTFVSGNIIYSSDGKMTYGIIERVGACDGSIISNNVVIGASVAPYLLIGANSVVLEAQQTSAPNTQTGATYTVKPSDSSIIINRAGTCTLTLPTAATYPGRKLRIKTIQSQTVVSNSSNVVPLAGGAAGTAILAATAGKWAELESDASNWIIMSSN